MGETEECARKKPKVATQASDARFRSYEKRYNNCTKQPLFMERGFSCFESNPLVTQVIRSHKWTTFCRNPYPASIPMVKEFYANYDYTKPDSVYVRGKLVDVTSSAINSFFSLPDHQNTFFENASNLSPLTVTDILKELTKYGTDLFASLNKDMNFPWIFLKAGPKIWSEFIKYNLLPGSNYNMVEKDTAVLLYCIMLGKPINVGQVIAKQIGVCASLNKGGLWFPGLITRLCERHKVFPSSCESHQQPSPSLFVKSEFDQETSLPNHGPLHRVTDDITWKSLRSLPNHGPSPRVTDDITWKSVLSLPNRDGATQTSRGNSNDGELSDVKWEPCALVSNVYHMLDCLPPPQPTKVSSFQSSIISVQGYMVKNNVAPTLEAIFKKHGDIATDCVFKTPSARTSFLEIVCEVVRRIETSDSTTIISEMEEIESQVSVAEAAKINVSWLRAHLEAIHKRNEAKKKSTLLVETKTNTILVNKAAQKDLTERCAELMVAQERFKKAERCVRVLDLVEKKLNNNFLESKAEKDSWVKQLLL